MPGYQNHAERRFMKVMELRKVRSEYKKYMDLIPQGNRYNAKKFFKTYSSKKTQKICTQAIIPITTLFNTNQGFIINGDILSCSSNVNPVTLVAAAPYPRIDDPQTAAAAVDQNVSASYSVPDTIQDSLFQAEITLSSQLAEGQQTQRAKQQRVLQRLDLRRIQPKYKRKMKSKGDNKSFYSNAIKFRKVCSNSKVIRLTSNHSDLLSTSIMADIHLSKYIEPFITQKDHTLSMTHSMVEEKVSADSTLSFTEVDEVTIDFAIINSSNTGQDSMNEDDSTEHNADQGMEKESVIDYSSKEDTIAINQVIVSQIITEFVDVDEQSGANKPEGPMDAPEPCMIDKNALIEGAIDQGSDAFIITAEADATHPKVERSSTDAPETCIIEEVTAEEILTDLAITEEHISYDQSKLEIGPMEKINISESISIKERILLATPPSSIMGVHYEEKVLIVTPPQSVTNFTTTITTTVTIEEEKNSSSPSLTKEGKKNIFSRMFKNKAGTLVPKKMKKMKTTKVWKRLFDSSDIFNKQKVK